MVQLRCLLDRVNQVKGEKQMLTKQDLIESILTTAPPGNVDLNILEGKNLDELKSILGDAILEAHRQKQALDEQLVEEQADRAARDYVSRMQRERELEPQRKAEREALEKANRAVFAEALKTLGISAAEGNFALLVQALNQLSVFNIQQFMTANPTALAPPTPAELQKREAERIEAHNQMLLNADPITLRRLAEQEAVQRRQAAQQAEDARQVAAREQKEQGLFEPIPEFNQLSGEKLDAAYFIKISNTNISAFRQAIRRWGAANVTARLRGIR
jgi:hypothetical protein